MKIKIHDYPKIQLMKELIDEFLPPDRYEVVEDDGVRDDECLHINLQGSDDRDEIKREIFRDLSALTGKRPDWGILTGVRPVKLAGELYHEMGSMDLVRARLQKEYFLTAQKAELITSMYEYQEKVCGEPRKNEIGIYIGIPFCPTRCLYCSFASNQVPDEEVARYLPALLREIRFCGKKMKEQNLLPESVYIGGGTPTTLNERQLDELLSACEASFDPGSLREFTVEAGRPDTITGEKLDVLKQHNVNRISINPQSMKQETLDRIGRSHSPEDIVRAFRMAKERDFDVINADLITGLPGEQPEDFRKTLETVLDLGANNITVHTLAVKKASRLIGIDRSYHYRVADIVAEMLADSRRMLEDAGFLPYYLYRQKHMAGYFENTGYCRDDLANLYNVRIMDEHQSILALGAGGISKLYYPSMNKLVRVPNVTNYTQYIDRIDEMCRRKDEGFFIEHE